VVTRRDFATRDTDFEVIDSDFEVIPTHDGKHRILICNFSRLGSCREVFRCCVGQPPQVGSALETQNGGLVRMQAEEEGIAEIFREAGFEWRLAGCSMCLAMNPDQLAEGERCASTSNRNFEGRQGYRGRTHLVSPAMAAAAAITGKLTDVREIQ